MILKIFTKVNKDRQPVIKGVANKFYSADEISITPPEKGDTIVKFELSVRDIEGSTSVKGEIDLDIQGYELLNAGGVIIERFITRTNI